VKVELEKREWKRGNGRIVEEEDGRTEGSRREQGVREKEWRK